MQPVRHVDRIAYRDGSFIAGRRAIPEECAVALSYDGSSFAVMMATPQLSVLVAVSAPTTLAVRTADAAGITLIGIARGDGFEIFTHPHRISQQHRSVHAA